MNESSLLLNTERHPLLSCDSVARLGRVIVIAPHPDDESLGCGGLLALLAELHQPAHVVVMTDGSASHPGSRAYPAARLASVRGTETLAALAVLGYPASAVTFMELRDGALPADDSPEFLEAAARLKALLIEQAPDTIVLPWRRDPHGDHRSTWRLCRAAASELALLLRWLEYPIWAWEPPEGDEAPVASEAKVWLLDITRVMESKQRAIAQHRSQLGTLIDDDANGFVLEPSMLAHFAHSWEIYLEPRHL